MTKIYTHETNLGVAADKYNGRRKLIIEQPLTEPIPFKTGILQFNLCHVSHPLRYRQISRGPGFPYSLRMRILVSVVTDHLGHKTRALVAMVLPHQDSLPPRGRIAIEGAPWS